MQFIFAPSHPENQNAKNAKKEMDKPIKIDVLRNQLRGKFRQQHGSVSAFCREKGITSAWLRLVFSGKYESDDLLLEAADFLDRFIANKQVERIKKQRLLAEKVAKLSL